jgi:hypothetical protein
MVAVVDSYQANSFLGPYPHIQIADFGLARPRAYEVTMSKKMIDPRLNNN